MEWNASTASAVGAVGGGVLGAVGSYFSGKSAEKFAERSYKHRYQWQMKDMRKAGLNPMLAFSQGAPNVPQPSYPDIGEGFNKGASGASSRSLQRSQIGNIAADSAAKLASAKASDAMAEKTRVETDLLGSYGSAEAQGRVDKLRQEVSESIVRAAEVMSRTDLNQQEFWHKEQHNPIIRRLDSALAAAKEAEIPLKELVAGVAESIASSLSTLSKVDGEALLKDTGNLIQDKLGDAGGTIWRSLTAPYRFIDGAWTGLKDYAQRTRRK